MSKLFSLIEEGKDIHVAPGNKILPGKGYTAIYDAQEMLQKVREDIEKYREEVEEECKNLREEARKEGFNEGLDQWSKELARFDETIQKIRDETEKIIVPLALKAAKKIVSREMEIDKNTVVDIVSNALRAVAHHRHVVIYVNKTDLDALEENRPRLKNVLEQVDSLALQARDDVDIGGCIIETEGGIINAQLENQWAALEKAFNTLMK
jgi:type III secretion protein L